MKKTFLTITSVAALATGMLFAQPPAPNPGRHRGPMAQRMVRFAQELNLTDAQKEQAKAIFSDVHQQAQPLAAQLRQNRKAVMEAVKSGAPEADIDRLTSASGPLIAQMSAIRAKAFEKFYALLTPEQKDKVGAHLNRFFEGGMHGGAGHRRPPVSQ